LGFIFSAEVFERFLSDLEYQGKLGPVVFDEIHKVITDSDYRDAFKNYHTVHSVKAVVFGLTGSLPPSLYPVLCELTAMNWKVIRTPSSRKELKYQVVQIKSESDMDTAIINHLNHAVSTYRPEDRAIVFCRSKNHVTALADLFKTHPYYSPGDNEYLLQKNKEAMVRWIAGDCRVMTSTSILGCGIDYPNIRDVVHRDPSFTMLDQYQEDSRGGRDGLECRATTFVVEKKRYPIPKQPSDLGTQTLYDMINDATQCR
jgi:superfamily II DNA helicase RecQ